MHSAVQRALQKGEFTGWSGLQAALRRLGSFGAMEGKVEDVHGQHFSVSSLDSTVGGISSRLLSSKGHWPGQGLLGS